MRRLAFTVSVAGVLLAGCAGGPPVAEPPVVAPTAAPLALPDPPVVATGLAVHLVWAGPADLDLFVTDPAGETFSVDRPGDVVAGDAGCTSDGGSTDGIETARWATPVAGRYRVGVDFPAACGDVGGVPYRVLVDVAGTRRRIDGTATPLQRTPNAVELVIP
jgi:hypothetical protein